MTKDDRPNKENAGCCIAYICDGDEPEHVCVSYRLDRDPQEFTRESESGKDNPLSFKQPIVALIEPRATKDEVVQALEQIRRKIDREGLYLGSWAHAGQVLEIFDEGERIHAELI